MRTPSGHQNSVDRRLADGARQPRSLVYAVLQLEESANSVGVHVIRYGRATKANRLLENLAQRQPQTFQFGLRQAACPASRPDAGTKQALVGINIAYSSKQRLVKQCGLDGKLASTKQRCELLCADHEGIGPRTEES